MTLTIRFLLYALGLGKQYVPALLWGGLSYLAAHVAFVAAIPADALQNLSDTLSALVLGIINSGDWKAGLLALPALVAAVIACFVSPHIVDAHDVAIDNLPEPPALP